MSKEISELQSKEICEQLNSTSSAYVYALALNHSRSIKSKNEVSHAKMKSVRLDSFTLSYVECDPASMCTIITPEIVFDPPLGSVIDVFHRIQNESKYAMGAKCRWLFTEPLPLLILIVMSMFGYITIILDEDRFLSTIDGDPTVSNLIMSIFGSVGTCYSAITFSFNVGIFLHVLEACFVTYSLMTKFSLSLAAVTKWFILVSCVGYPITRKALDFIKIDDKKKK